MATAISTAIGAERISRASAYKLSKGNFGDQSGNLLQQIVVLAEANTANQGTMPTGARRVASAAEAAKLYGYGSPIHQIMRILRPVNEDGVGGIPTIVMAQATAGGATASVQAWTITGPATKSITHYFVIAGRYNVDFTPYAVNIVIGDTATQIAAKYANAINAVLGSPVSAVSAAGVVTITTKWKGATAAALISSIDINGDAAGLTYAQTTDTDGTGVVDIAPALALFEDNWYTTVINSYGTATLSALEQFNGFPDDNAPTGRYQGRVFKPFMAFFGNTSTTYTDLTAITDSQARVNQVTNVLCPAPGSAGFPWEAAANMVRLFCRIMQDTPHLDVSGKYYPDMPIPATGVIGDMSSYEIRDLLVKAGSSTVLLVNGQYQVEDLVTTYHPNDDAQFQYRYARNLNLDWNVKDRYAALEKVTVMDHVIVQDNQVTSVSNAIKPKEWKAVIFGFIEDLSDAALIEDPDFSKANVYVQIDPNNPNRFNTLFRYKRTGIARITSTDAQAGF